MITNKPFNVNPLDTKNVGIGIAFPFNSNNGVFNSTYTTKDQIKSNILNLFLTNKRERIFQPELGINLNLFENITEEYLIAVQDSIVELITNNFPEVTIKELTISELPDQNSINIYLSYMIYNGQDEINVNING